MPLKEHITWPDRTELGVWSKTESEDFFLSRLDLHPEESNWVKELKAGRKKEWLASRHLLHRMSGRVDRAPCLKDEFGKPYLKNSSFHISISHSRDLVAVMASPIICGIDIQYKVNKIYRIESKFVRMDEAEAYDGIASRIDWLHVLWGAKESLYKAYGRRKLDFKKNLVIRNYYPAKRGHCKGFIKKDDFYQEYSVLWDIYEEVYLVHVLQKH